MTVPPQTRAIIDTMLAFANLARLDSDQQLAGLFQRLPFKWARGRQQWFQGQAGLAAGPRDSTGRIYPYALQREVRSWLDLIVQAKGDPRKLRPVAFRVSEALRRTTHLTLKVDPSSLGLVPVLRVGLGLTAEDVCTLGVAYLFEWQLLRRVKKCPIEGCGRYRVTYRGKPWNYCSRAHQRQGEEAQARIRAKRARLRKGE